MFHVKHPLLMGQLEKSIYMRNLVNQFNVFYLCSHEVQGKSFFFSPAYK